jgi:hypothetical protein
MVRPMLGRHKTALLLLGLLPAGPMALATDSPMELRQVQNDLLAWLPGRYSSASQVYFETAAGAPPAGSHPRVERRFVRIAAPLLGEAVIYSEARAGGKDGPLLPEQSLLLIPVVDAKLRGVRLQVRPLLDAAANIDLDRHPERIAGLRLGADLAGGCALAWRRHGAQLLGRTGKCARQIEWLLNDQELWIADSRARNDGSHLRLSKVRDYECLFGFRPKTGEPQVFNGARMHDGGDVHRWVANDTAPRPVHFELIRGMWPSESGRNYTELLRINLYEGEPGPNGTVAIPNKVLGSGWASTESDRASFNTREFSGRCKLFDPTAPPPK